MADALLRIREPSKSFRREADMSFRRSSHFVFSTLLRRTGMLLASLTLLATSQAFGQGITTGSITGTVEDPQGRVIPSAKVVAVQNGTNTAYTAPTNSAGAFEIHGLAVGSYTVTIESAGFSKTQLNDVATNAGRATSVGVQTLNISATAESVT